MATSHAQVEEDAVLAIEGMSCAGCVRNVEQSLAAVPGVRTVSVNFASGQAQVFGAAPVTTLVAAVEAAGYSAHVPIQEGASARARHLKQTLWGDLLRAAGALATGALLMFAGDVVVPRLHPWLISLAVLFVLWIAGNRFFVGAWHALKQGRTTMDSLIVMGVGAAWTFSMMVMVAPDVIAAESRHLFFDTALFIVGFVRLGKSLEEFARGRTSLAISALLDLRPKYARVINAKGEVDVALADVVKGDRIVVRAGEAIPVDGDLISGSCSVDEQMITGESEPVQKSEGAFLTGGTINLDGVVTMRATKVGAETVLARMAAAVEQAQNSKPPIAELADLVASYFVPLVIMIAVTCGIGWWLAGQSISFSVAIFMTVLVIACPCALGLAIPMSVMIGMGRGAELGFLIRHSDALQAAAKVDTLVIDKTGTLTLGTPEVTSFKVCDGQDAELMKSILLGLESVSLHPLALAITKYVSAANKLTIEDIVTEPGLGIRGQLDGQMCLVGNEQLFLNHGYQPFEQSEQDEAHASSLVYVGWAGKWLGVVAARDALRTDAHAMVEAVQQQAVRVVILSGDRIDVVKPLAESLGIDQWQGQLSPEQKQQAISGLQAEGRVVAMVGDGINDALSLSQANVGIAMGTGSDVAIESADVTLMGGQLQKVPTVLGLAKRVLANIKQNLFAAFIYNICLIPIAAGLLYPVNGLLLDPGLAGLAMALSSISVVANAMRLKLVAS